MSSQASPQPKPENTQRNTGKKIDPAEITVLRPSREHVLGGIVMFLICLVFAGYKLAWFFWVPVIPLLFIVWVLRVRTIVSPAGLETKYFFAKGHRLSWKKYKSIRFNKSGKAFAVDTEDNTFWLPGVSFNSLVTLSKASSGIIPDPVTAGRLASHDKVQVVHKDGYAVLMDKEEYAAYEAQRRRDAGQAEDDQAADNQAAQD